MKIIFCTSLILILFALACKNNSNPLAPDRTDIDNIKKAPITLKIDSTNFNLSIYLWRDYMPISPIDGKPMRASVQVYTTDSSLFPQNIDADKLWVIDSTDIWETNLTNDSFDDSSFQIYKKASDGPKWKTGIIVDAVVRLVQDDSIYYYLKSENIIINRTD